MSDETPGGTYKIHPEASEILAGMIVALMAERDAERARAEAAELDLARTNENYRACVRINLERIAERDAFEQQLSHVEDQLLESRAQIVRLMAERDEAQAERNELRDRLTETKGALRIARFLATDDDPTASGHASTHNPFREFGGDRRRVGS